MNKNYLIAGSFFGALAVALGAFGAHALKEIVPPETVAAFQTGVQYQMYHALALLSIGIIFDRFSNKWMKWAGNSFIAGIFLFSGSLFLLTALKAADQTGFKGVGIITPFGGVFFILGWLSLLMGIIKKN